MTHDDADRDDELVGTTDSGSSGGQELAVFSKVADIIGTIAESVKAVQTARYEAENQRTAVSVELERLQSSERTTGKKLLRDITMIVLAVLTLFGVGLFVLVLHDKVTSTDMKAMFMEIVKDFALVAAGSAGTLVGQKWWRKKTKEED